MTTLQRALPRFGLALLLVAAIALAMANRRHIDVGAVIEGITELGPWAPLAYIALYVVATVVFLPGSILTRLLRG
jgi:uncharacterized membrane protein YdjX (TVP38/TMEM64 family)